jgi:hypothetical protein
MKLDGKLESDEVEAIVKAELVRRFPMFRIDYLHVPYVSGTRFTLDDELDVVPAPAESVPASALKPLAADGSNF